ncbi:MAG: GNAT family N-acetyltransferase [Bacteroidales bacterium]|nr:GNAT family N-acetyltransferase [Clostridium sp.]MCM1203150.1 GNAT family N-acetyltransferase [Bacteroidales bacterium]
MIVIKENQLQVDEYLAIRKEVGWVRLSESQAEKALDCSLFVLGAYEGEKLVGMGRIVGDGAVICYVQDLIVVPDYQHRGVGSLVLSALVNYVEGLREEGCQMMLCLMCAKGREEFYEKHGFLARPTTKLGPGMIQYLKE